MERQERQDKTKEQEKRTCARCSNETVSQMCIQCNTKLCDQCVAQHDSFPEHKQHSVIELTNLSDSDRETLDRVVEATRKCEDHDLRPTRYCLKCKATVCPECYITRHRDRETILPEMVSSVKEDMEQIQRDARRLALDLDIEMRTCEENVNSFTKDGTKVTKAIQSWFEKVRKALTEKEANMIEDANSFVENESEKENQMKTEIENCTTSLGKLQTNIECTIRLGTDLFIVAEKQEFHERLFQLQKDTSELKKKTRQNPPLMTFAPNNYFMDSVDEVAHIEKGEDDIEDIEEYEDILGVLDTETFGSPESERYANTISTYSDNTQRQLRRSLPDLPSTRERIPRRAFSTSVIGQGRADTAILYENNNPSSITFTREKRMDFGTRITGRY